MPAAVVVIPATPLLVPGAAGGAEVLGGTRTAVRAALAPWAGAAGRGRGVAVLAAGCRARAGRLRPSLAGAGVADARVPLLASPATGLGAGERAGERDVAWDGVAGTGASVALLALADAGLDLAAHPVDVVEVPADAAGPQRAALPAALDRLGAADVVVAADLPAPGVDAVLEELARGWRCEEVVVTETGDHLPGRYRVQVRRPR
ncbi:hypothetical protein DNL40_03410 [Xylanimonas oleitrophica]|uniref:Uncharacterized protein n=1 Tax=Xylanimonas oleitrophica TaxID=2607479 RepID=A0A2W5WVC9_9MICO|nr:hypothetical protein [Xylanimonas oleitrophica]PZR55419.1 hypothetical protein DNL40_03410 [Xylanimonas oleitrophica]